MKIALLRQNHIEKDDRLEREDRVLYLYRNERSLYLISQSEAVLTVPSTTLMHVVHILQTQLRISPARRPLQRADSPSRGASNGARISRHP